MKEKTKITAMKFNKSMKEKKKDIIKYEYLCFLYIHDENNHLNLS